MKVEVKKIEINPTRIYPYIGISNNECIVLFNEPRSGICLNRGSTNNKVGEYSECWSECSFQMLKGEITLSND